MENQNNYFESVKSLLRKSPKRWLVTGVAGFIGSNILEELLSLDQEVVGMDNFITGRKENLQDVRQSVTQQQWDKFTFLESDIRDLESCRKACQGIDFVLHQGALGSVPRSIERPELTYACNVNGHLHMMIAAKDNGVKSFVYASSSSVYGDHPGLPKKEEIIGTPLSPYAASKLSNEINASVFHRVYGLNVIGLRYFNVFGKRQNPYGPYAAVIPKWAMAMSKNEEVVIFGDGLTGRDFCYIKNVVQMNILSAVCEDKNAFNQIYNVAYGEKTTLNDLFELLRVNLMEDGKHLSSFRPIYKDFRPGDIRNSLADCSKAQKLLGYRPLYSLKEGIKESVGWYKTLVSN